MCAITRDYTGHAETRLLCEEGILGPCDHCDDTAIVADWFGTLCALHVGGPVARRVEDREIVVTVPTVIPRKLVRRYANDLRRPAERLQAVPFRMGDDERVYRFTIHRLP